MKGDIRIVQGKALALSKLPDFLEQKSETARVIYRLLQEMMASEQISELLTDFCKLANVSAAIIDLDANVLAASKWQRLCTDFNRANPRSCEGCIQSDMHLANRLQEGERFTLYACENGLTDCASPILIEGEHVANVFIGQFLLQQPDLNFFQQHAASHGFEWSDYHQALQEVPIVAEEKIPHILSYLVGFARLIARMGLDRYSKEKAAQKAREDLEKQVLLRTKELARAKEEAEKSNRTKDKFISIISHDLRGPMGSLSVLLNEVIRTPKDFTPELHEMARNASKATQQLLEDLLDWSKQQRGDLELHPRDFDLYQLVEENQHLFTHLSQEKNLRLELDIAPGSYVHGDRNMINAVLRNLVANAIKFSPPGNSIRLGALQEGERWRLEVEDHGIGMAPARIKTLFRATPRRDLQEGTQGEKGSGLGLILTKEFIEKHGSQIEVASQLGQGSCFSFYLPLAQGGETAERRQALSAQLSKFKALLVEDNPLHIETSKKALHHLGIQHELALNGLLALEKALEGGYQLILMDIELPWLNGVEVAKKLRQMNTQAWVIALSSYDKAELISRGEAKLFDSYLQKPLRPDELFDELLGLNHFTQNA